MELITKHLCPYCERVDMALKLRKISSETVHIIQTEDGVFPANLVALNPNKTFPTLRITSSTGFAESMVIVEYLDSIEAAGPKLYGNNPENIAKTKFNIETLQNKINKYIQSCIYTYNSVVEERKALQSIPKAFDALGALLESRESRFLGGDELNAEDVYIAPFIMRYFAIHANNKNVPLPESSTRVGKYFHDISHHSIVRKCISNIDEISLYMKKYNALKGLNVDKIKNSSRQLITNLDASTKTLNANCKNMEWQLGKNNKGNFICTKFKFENSEHALKTINLLNEIQEATDHHASFTLENFSALKIELCTHQPKYGVTEMDISFAEVLAQQMISLK